MICEIPNYIPHNKSMNVTYKKWFRMYEKDVRIVYFILIKHFHQNFDNEHIQWDMNFNRFCKLVYKKSSKYLILDYKIS